MGLGETRRKPAERECTTAVLFLAVGLCVSSSRSTKTIIQTREQMRNRFLGFIAHVGEPKCLFSEFAVAGIDDEMMFFAEFSRKIDNVDAFVVLYAGERS